MRDVWYTRLTATCLFKLNTVHFLTQRLTVVALFDCGDQQPTQSSQPLRTPCASCLQGCSIDPESAATLDMCGPGFSMGGATIGTHVFIGPEVMIADANNKGNLAKTFPAQLFAWTMVFLCALLGIKPHPKHLRVSKP